MADVPKLDLKSKDIAADKQQKLKELFPEIFTEGDKIDFDKLRLTLGDSVDANDERFGLHWAGKKECFSIIQEPSIGTLKPAKEESINWDDTENLFIEGDNLEVLKLLQKSYYGKVKMIYIDPPYNTGKEFIYPDRYQENIDTYLAYTGQIDDNGYKFSSNAETEGRYHSNWLNMMYPRLFLARNLLKEDGIIFISIDDNEVDNLKKMCAEIFGEENFVSNLIWQKKYSPQNDAKWFSNMHDHILCFAKNKDIWRPNLLARTEKQNARYSNPDKDPRGNWKASDFSVKTYSKEYDYPIKTPSGRIVNPPKGRCWRTSKTNFEKLISENRIWFGETGGNVPSVKKFLTEVKQGVTPSTIWLRKDVGDNQEAAKEIRELFDIPPFDTPKPSRLISKMVEIGTKEQDIILDFFAGSCSTAHSVHELNKKKGQNRKYIMVQLPEPTQEKSNAYKEGYKNIADIGKERIRRVIKNIVTQKQTLETELQSKEAALTELEAKKAKTPKLFENGKSKDLADLETSIEEMKTKIANIKNTDLGFKVGC